MQKNEKWLWSFVAVLILGIAATATFKLRSPILRSGEVRVLPDSGCDLQHGACTNHFDRKESVIFSVNPRPIRALQQLQLTVETSLNGVTGVDVDFTGTDMDMGYNRFRLQPSGDGRFSGAAMLPICSHARMSWLATVSIHRGKHTVQIPYRFDTVNPNS